MTIGNWTIKTEFIYPPIPDRRSDWMAWIDGMEESGVYGLGPTELEAINRLREEMEEKGWI